MKKTERCESCSREHDFDRLTARVHEWAEVKGIHAQSSSTQQFRKFLEEVGELEEIFLELVVSPTRENQLAFEMEVGDVLVTLINTCYFRTLDLGHCLEAAVEKITKRSGEMREGLFVKQEDIGHGCEAENPSTQM